MELNAALTVALAMVIGVLTQAMAHHLKVPGIILLLMIGVFLGPDGLEWIQPQALGDGLHTLVGFAVAIILFEGGMSLHLDRIRKEAVSIRRLITLGAVISFVGGMLAAKLFMPGWSWRTAALFGSLIVVTGPTVVSPLLKRLRVKRAVSTVLEAEGVLIDAIGAIGAVVTLEIAIQPTGHQLAEGATNVFLGLGLGCLMGFLWGMLMSMTLRVRNLIPEGLEKVFTLTATLALFQLANHWVHESGIAAVTVAGMVVGNRRFHVLRDLHAFKEQLTQMLIGMLFILLAADVRIADVEALGWPGVWVVMSLALVVRPISVFVSTRKSDLSTREKVFISWIGPRGIIAAAVASLFASNLDQAGIPGGPTLRALVFLVIALSVLTAGLTGGPMARFLRLQRPTDQGWVILGANPLALLMAKLLKERKEQVLCIDTDATYCQRAEQEDIRVMFGNGLERRTLQRAEIDTRLGAIGLSENEAVNLLFVKEARETARTGHFATLLKTETTGITPEMVHNSGCQLLFGGWRNLEDWCAQIESGRTRVEWWKWLPERRRSIPDYFATANQRFEHVIPLLCVHGKKVMPVDGKVQLKPADEVAFLMLDGQDHALHRLLNKDGWEPLHKVRTTQSAPVTPTEEAETPAPVRGTPQIESSTNPVLSGLPVSAADADEEGVEDGDADAKTEEWEMECPESSESFDIAGERAEFETAASETTADWEPGPTPEREIEGGIEQGNRNDFEPESGDMGNGDDPTESVNESGTEPVATDDSTHPPEVPEQDGIARAGWTGLEGGASGTSGNPEGASPFADADPLQPADVEPPPLPIVSHEANGAEAVRAAGDAETRFSPSVDFDSLDGGIDGEGIPSAEREWEETREEPEAVFAERGGSPEKSSVEGVPFEILGPPADSSQPSGPYDEGDPEVEKDGATRGESIPDGLESFTSERVKGVEGGSPVDFEQVETEEERDGEREAEYPEGPFSEAKGSREENEGDLREAASNKPAAASYDDPFAWEPLFAPRGREELQPTPESEKSSGMHPPSSPLDEATTAMHSVRESAPSPRQGNLFADLPLFAGLDAPLKGTPNRKDADGPSAKTPIPKSEQDD